MISTHYKGRLGNNLFQFAFSAILAKQAGIPLSAGEILGFPGTASHTTKLAFGGTSLRVFNQELPCLNKLSAIAQKQDVVIVGHVQSTHYYEPHKQWLHQLLAPRLGAYTKTGEKDVVLHLRIGDFFRAKPDNKFLYPVEGIYTLLKRIDFERCYIVTDSPKDHRVDALRKSFPCEIISGKIMDDYRTLYHAKRLIITPSTFSWWPAWSGCSNEIYCPFDLGYWKVQNNSLLLRGEKVRYWNKTGLLDYNPK